MTDSFLQIESEIFSYNKALSMDDMHKTHFHNSYELYYLISGRRRYLVDHRVYDLVPGDLIIIPPKTIHKTFRSPENIKEGYFERYLFSIIEPNIPSQLKKCFSQHYFHLQPEDSKKVKEIFEHIKHESENHDEYSVIMYNQYLTNILVLLLRKYQTVSSRVQQFNRKIDKIIYEATTYICENYQKDLSLAEISERFGLTKEYFSSEFKKSIGCNYSEYLNKTRLANCAKLLTTTVLPIKEIAWKCGFKDSNYFSAVFKKAFGTNPMSYRKNSLMDFNEP